MYYEIECLNLYAVYVKTLSALFFNVVCLIWHCVRQHSCLDGCLISSTDFSYRCGVQRINCFYRNRSYETSIAILFLQNCFKILVKQTQKGMAKNNQKKNEQNNEQTMWSKDDDIILFSSFNYTDVQV